ncbi:hypothetical protein [Haladaptatus sp. R4]|uniref:hypothetical protein n=1 Tax=Haladaptatus sp. R4 TaxID=1679489 RepID=UPI000AC98530|nr:hypothetical protein [Haladaptatus sp. R4]
MVKIGLGNVLAAFIGAVAALSVAYLRVVLEKNKKREKLRNALLAELQSTNRLDVALDMLNSSTGVYFYIHHDFIPTSTYESNLSDIGLLSEDEIEPVISYYSDALITKQERRACEKIVEADRDLHQETSAIDSFKNSVKILQGLRETAIKALEKELDKAIEDDEKETPETPHWLEHQGVRLKEYIKSPFVKQQAKLSTSTLNTLRKTIFVLLLFSGLIATISGMLIDKNILVIVGGILFIIWGNYVVWIYNSYRKYPIRSFSWRTKFLADSVFLIVLLTVLTLADATYIESNSAAVGGFALYLILKDVFELYFSERTSFSSSWKKKWVQPLSHILGVVTGIIAAISSQSIQLIFWIIISQLVVFITAASPTFAAVRDKYYKLQ